MRGLAGPALTRMGWEPADDEDGRTRELRAVLFELLGVLGADTNVRERAATLHAAYLEDRQSVDPALAAAAVAVLAESAATPEEAAERFDQFWERHRHPATPQEEVRYLFALARIHDDTTFRRILDLSITEVRTQNGPFLLRQALVNRTHGPMAWDFLAEHWTEINERLPSNGIARMLEGIVALSAARRGQPGPGVLPRAQRPPGDQDPGPAPRAPTGERGAPRPGGLQPHLGPHLSCAAPPGAPRRAPFHPRMCGGCSRFSRASTGRFAGGRGDAAGRLNVTPHRHAHTMSKHDVDRRVSEVALRQSGAFSSAPGRSLRRGPERPNATGGRRRMASSQPGCLLPPGPSGHVAHAPLDRAARGG